MHFIKNTNWKEIFAGWRSREGHDPGWIHCATKIKGWPDWESWRQFTASRIGADKLDWKIYEFDDPLEEITDMLVGPFTNWQSRLPLKNQNTFADLVEIPEQFEFFSHHEKVLSMLKNFPCPTELIGLIKKDNGKIVCWEGHHRAAAMALAQKNHLKLELRGRITIALAELSDVKILDKVLKRGTTYKSTK